jgi:hypothetical protein
MARIPVHLDVNEAGCKPEAGGLVQRMDTAYVAAVELYTSRASGFGYEPFYHHRSSPREETLKAADAPPSR